MIDVEYVQMMARYSTWQNASLINAAETLEDADRCKDRGAFFGSIQGTMNHLLWGDRIWMHRFAGTAKPNKEFIQESISETDNWAMYRSAREEMDIIVSSWSLQLDPAWLAGELTWFSTAANRTICKPKQALAVHFFNHGTHHRGQIHALLTSAGGTPMDTDIPLLPD